MNRTVPSPKALDLAERILAHEAGTGSSSETNVPLAVRTSEKLRRELIMLAGVAGFYALLSRALALAKTQVPSLKGVNVKPDGSLEGLSELYNEEEGTKANVMLIAQLFDLLITFIGESLTLRLVRDVWPDFILDATDSGEERKST